MYRIFKFYIVAKNNSFYKSIMTVYHVKYDIQGWAGLKPSRF